MRRLILELRVDSNDGQHLRESRVYQRSVGDRQGTLLSQEHFAFLKGAQVLSDTRLAPGETKKETFTFTIPSGIQTQVKASLKYFYSPMARSGLEQETHFLTMSQLVR